MIGYHVRAGMAACALLMGLSACSNTPAGQEGSGIGTALRQAAAEAVAARRGSSEAPVAPRTPQQRAEEALRLNPGPLIMVGLENLGTTQIMALTGQNGAMRTYMTPNEQALILRGGMLVGTRGLGNDMSVTEPQTETLIRNGQSGSGQRILRYYTGDGLETPLRFDCTTGPGPNPGIMVENCAGHGVTFQNNYQVQGGQITVSRQWGGPALGYLTIQTLRP
ncbi:YjbF family lipoprotein [Paracoccus gahaiensis]|nr:YjbF family lipoprotein [Paracoccus gahaiensis]